MMDFLCEATLFFAKRRKIVRVVAYEKLPPFPVEEEVLRLPELHWKETPEPEPPRAVHGFNVLETELEEYVPPQTPAETDNTPLNDDSGSASEYESEVSMTNANGALHLPEGLLPHNIAVEYDIIGNRGHRDREPGRYACSYCVLSSQDTAPRPYPAALIHRAICPYNPNPDPGDIPEGLMPYRATRFTSTTANIPERYQCAYCVTGGGRSVERELGMALTHRAWCDRNPHKEKDFVPEGLLAGKRVLYCDKQGNLNYREEEKFQCIYCVAIRGDTLERALGEALIHRASCLNNRHRDNDTLPDGLVRGGDIRDCDTEGGPTDIDSQGDDRFECLYCVENGARSAGMLLSTALFHRAHCELNPKRDLHQDISRYSSHTNPPNPRPSQRKPKKTRQHLSNSPTHTSLRKKPIKRPRTETPADSPRKRQRTTEGLNSERIYIKKNENGIEVRKLRRMIVGDARPQWTCLEGIFPIDDHSNGVQLIVPESQALYLCEYCRKGGSVTNALENPPRNLQQASAHRVTCPHNPHKSEHANQHNRLYGTDSYRWKGKKVTGVEYMDVETERGTRVACRACVRFNPDGYKTWKQESGFRCHWQFCVWNCDNNYPETASIVLPEMSTLKKVKQEIHEEEVEETMEDAYTTSTSGRTALKNDETETPCPEVSRTETPRKNTRSPPRPPLEMLSPPVPITAKSVGNESPRPITPPLAKFTPERSRQFRPPQASPSFVLSPPGISAKLISGEILVGEPMVFPSRATLGSDDVATGRANWEGQDVMIID